MDTSGNAAFGASVRSFPAESRYADVRYVDRVVAEPGLADRPRGPNSAAVRLACARIYNQMVREVTTPYVLVVEDDILPPLGVIDRLLHALDRDTAVVVAPYRGARPRALCGLGRDRRTPSRRRGHPDDRRLRFRLRAALRTSILRDATFSYGFSEPIDFDPAFCRRLRRDGWTIKIDWSQEMRASGNRNRLMTPSLPECDYRKRLPDGLACGLLGKLADVADESLLRVSDDACLRVLLRGAARCSATESGHRLVAGSTGGKSAPAVGHRTSRTVASLRELARRHLAVVYGEDCGSAEPRRAHEACYYLGPPLCASTTAAGPPVAPGLPASGTPWYSHNP